MKHVFIVHSNITFIVTRATIAEEKIEKEDVIIFTNRNYKIPYQLSANVFELPSESIKITANFIGNYIRFKKYISIINEKIGSIYHLYTPHTYDERFSLLVSNKNCKKFSYIEEGTASYVEKGFKVRKKLSFVKKIFKVIRYGSRLLTELLYEYTLFCPIASKLSVSYGLSQEAFKWLPKRKVLNGFGGFETNEQNEQYDCIVIFDALSLVGLLSFETIIKMTKEIIITHIQDNNYSKVAYKLHPAHSDLIGVEEGVKIDEFMLELDMGFTKLNNDFIVEDYLVYHKVKIYSFVSSIGLYSSLLGNVTYSLSDRVVKENPEIEVTKIGKLNFIQI